MKKKISIVTSGHPYYDERIFYKFARSLNKNGYEVSIICSTVESEIDLVKDNIHIKGFNGSNLKKSQKVSKFADYLKNIKPDVIICCEPLPILAAGKIRRSNKKVKIIYDVTEWYPHQNMLKNLSGINWVFSYFYLFIFNIFCASKSDHLIFGEKKKAVPYKIFLPFKTKSFINYYPSLDFARNYLPHFDPSSFTVAYVGIINKQRGIFTFLNVMQKVQAQLPGLKIKGKIIGNFEDEDIEMLIHEHVENRQITGITFTGRIPYTELSNQLYDVSLCLDLRERNFFYNNSFPIKIFEFMACGKPVVYSNIKSLSKFSDINKIGYLVDPSNIDKICSTVINYINDQQLLRQHSKEARLLFENKYNWEKIESELLLIVSQI